MSGGNPAFLSYRPEVIRPKASIPWGAVLAVTAGVFVQRLARPAARERERGFWSLFFGPKGRPKGRFSFGTLEPS